MTGVQTCALPIYRKSDAGSKAVAALVLAALVALPDDSAVLRRNRLAGIDDLDKAAGS